MKKNFEKYSDSLQPFFEMVGRLSMIQRVIIVIVTFSLLIGSFTLFSYKDKFKTIKETNKKYEKVKKELDIAKKKAALLDDLQAEWDKKQEEFNLVMAALPDKKEIPSLLAEISKAGKNAGLDFYQFAPRGEVARDFYAEIPVSIKLKGSYFSIARFFKNISKMSRIVNIKNIVMNNSDKEGMLSLDCTAVTYRFLTVTKE
ncbi:MAG: type 4a pilus biogenesis protein PilO [Thermodesulfobacteriota bacterium]|nr:type 4a pilus biogenesis protein PilO [Thermodesulfobacteriota bacterium]